MLFQLMCNRMSQSYNPNIAETILVWALPRSLATTSGIIIIFSSCGYLDVSVPRVRLSIKRYHAFNMMGCPIRKSPDQRLFAPTRRLSQLTTSFIASSSQGIHRLPFCFLLFIFTTRCALRTPFSICFLSTNTSKISFTTCVINRGE